MKIPKIQIEYSSRFGVRTMLLLMLACALLMFSIGPEFSEWKSSYRTQRIVNVLKNPPVGAAVYEYQVDENGYFKQGTGSGVSRFTSWVSGKRSKAKVYRLDNEEVFPEIGRLYPRVTVDTLLRLASGDYHDLRFLKPEDEIVRLIPGKSYISTLSGIEKLQHLEEVDLSSCRNLQDISALFELPSLKRVDLSKNTRVDIRQIAQLIETFPDAEVLIDRPCEFPDLCRADGDTKTMIVSSVTKTLTKDLLEEAQWTAYSDELNGVENVVFREPGEIYTLDWLIPGTEIRSIKIAGHRSHSLRDFSALGKISSLEEVEVSFEAGGNLLHDPEVKPNSNFRVRLETKEFWPREIGGIADAITDLEIDFCFGRTYLDIDLDQFPNLQKLTISTSAAGRRTSDRISLRGGSEKVTVSIQKIGTLTEVVLGKPIIGAGEEKPFTAKLLELRDCAELRTVLWLAQSHVQKVDKISCPALR